MSEPTTPLDILATMGPEQLVEGAHLGFTRTDGTTYTVTIGPVVQTATDDTIESAFHIRYSTGGGR